jgi:hypothetical protein
MDHLSGVGKGKRIEINASNYYFDKARSDNMFPCLNIIERMF